MPRKNQRGTLLLGLLLVAVGLAIFLAPAGSGLGGWLMRLWPVFMICAGVVRVMGYAVERKPRSPMGGALLIIIGAVFFVSRFHSNLNAIQIYSRYWLLLLAVLAAVELVRFYSHRQTEGPQPRLFTAGRLIIVLLIVTSGVIASRVAANPSLLSSLHLPKFLNGLRDSVVGEVYAFSDEPVESRDVRAGMKITVNNSFGSIKIVGGATLRTTLTKGVRAWSEADARNIADQIRLVITPTPDGLSITTNREQFNQEFTTDIQLVVPSFANLAVTGTHNSVSATNLQGNLAIQASHSQTDASNINGNVNFDLNYADVNASNINGNLTISGAKGARVANVTGALRLSASASNGSVDLREVAGPANVDAPFCRITAQALKAESVLKTEHARVDVTRTVNLSIDAPFSDVRARNVDGDLKVTASHSEVQLSAIQGDLEVRAEQCSVKADDVQGAIDIQTSHGDVTVKNFHESVRVETSYRNVSLMASDQPESDIDIANNHGEIKLILPPASQFRLDAQSENGQIRPLGFSELPTMAGDKLVGGTGGDGPTIKLRTSYSNIIIQASGARQAQAGPVAR
jgi:DUF4097 and DUF4098 domain-containing protein YvlB/uncharacterized membrane protein HdeD (DUF308 family)